MGCRVKIASGHISSLAPLPVPEKQTDCLHSPVQRVYTVNLGGELAVLCEVCYGHYSTGHEVVIHPSQINRCC